MSAENDDSPDAIDWRLTTWEGARAEQRRRWAAMPLRDMILALEEMQELAERLAPSGAGREQR